MVSKWDTLGIDQAMAEDIDLNAISTRPPTREEMAYFCDKNFPSLHLANMADEAVSGEGMTLTQTKLPCGWFVFSYRRGDCYLLMMTSRYAGRNHAPLPPSAPEDLSEEQGDESTESPEMMLKAATPLVPDQAAESEDDNDSEGGDAPEDDEISIWDMWDDEDDGEGDTSRELGWQAMSRLAAAQTIDLALEKGMSKAAVIGGTQYMIESAYLAAKGYDSDYELTTDLSKADKKRLDTRVKHLLKEDSFAATP